jgi:hypothetical protein
MLWDAVCNARKHLEWSEYPRLECSDNDRYTVTMLLSQYLSFPIIEQSKILDTIGFTRDELLDIMRKHIELLDDLDLDIIFGWEKTKGKIYLNCVDGYMVSYRSDKSMKMYIPYLGNDNILAVYSGEELVGLHKRIGNRWIAYNLDGTILHRYWRPLPEFIMVIFDLFF